MCNNKIISIMQNATETQWFVWRRRAFILENSVIKIMFLHQNQYLNRININYSESYKNVNI